MIIQRFIYTVVLIVLSLSTPFLLAKDESLPKDVLQTWSAGFRVAILSAGGDPVNDITASAGFAQYRLSESWLIDLSFQYAEYDFESIHYFVNAPSSLSDGPASRSRVTSTSLAIEREWRDPSVLVHPFILFGLGLGYAVIDDVNTVVGDQPVDIRAEGGIEGITTIGCGIRFRHVRWIVECGARLEQHFADWDIENRVSWQQVSIGDYTAWGGWLGLGVPL
ncbi:MAG: hypothetical protein PHR77_17170 [Kiritimatiellae bacterium]|nr:hypothetical protein [Kiritimatiellia bacterium]MDD5521572.1 hypothetical protein [Kiritimatiellia bacterium]